MVVHQTASFALGLLVSGGGLLLLLCILYECLKSKTIPSNARKPLILAMFMICMGGRELSRSFDWLGHASYRTRVVEWVTLPIVLGGVALLYLLKRADKRASANVGTTASGEHTT